MYLTICNVSHRLCVICSDIKNQLFFAGYGKVVELRINKKSSTTLPVSIVTTLYFSTLISILHKTCQNQLTSHYEDTSWQALSGCLKKMHKRNLGVNNDLN